MRFFVTICPMIFFLIGCSHTVNANYSKKPWYKNAVEYVSHDQTIFENKIKNSREGVEHLQSRYAVEKLLADSKPPTADELTTLLRSADPENRKVALVNIMLRQYSDMKLYGSIVDLLESENDMILKYYSYNCLKKLGKDKVNAFNDRLLNIFLKEDSEGLILSIMPTLIKIDSHRLVDVFVSFLTDGSPIIKQLAYINLKNIDEKYQQEIIEELKRRNIWKELLNNEGV